MSRNASERVSMIRRTALGISLLLSTTSGGLACECLTVGSGGTDYAKQVRDFDAVFRTTVLQIHELRFPTIPPKGDEFYRLRLVVFDADAAWAGIKARRVLVFTGIGAGDCGYDFTMGRSYLVWARRDEWLAPGELATGICTYTASIEEAKEQLRQLGRPRALER